MGAPGWVPATSAKTLDGLRAISKCHACGSLDLTPAGSMAGLMGGAAAAAFMVPVNADKAFPPMRRCRTCGWTIEVA